MPIFGDELEAVEICAHLGDVVDHGSDAKDGGMSTIVLHINKTQLQNSMSISLVMNLSTYE